MYVSLEMVGAMLFCHLEEKLAWFCFSARAGVTEPQMSRVSKQQVKTTGNQISTASTFKNISIQLCTFCAATMKLFRTVRFKRKLTLQKYESFKRFPLLSDFKFLVFLIRIDKMVRGFPL